MKIDRAALRQHLQKVTCNGQISGAVFSNSFATNALTEDQLLAVVAPGLPEVEALPEPIGLPDLSLLIKGLDVLSGSGNEGVAVSVYIDNHRLIVDEEHRGSLRLMTAQPKTIGTAVEPATMERLLAGAPSTNGLPLTRALIDGIQSTFGLLKAHEVEVHVGPNGGKIVVGSETAHMAEFNAPTLTTETEYSLLFGRHLVDVLSGVTNFAQAEMFLGGPDHIIMIKDGAYRYILSPRKRVADAS